jgi:5-methylcytosine-specific restriction endonuclease McrA
MPANHCKPHNEEAKRKISQAKRGKALVKKRRPMKVAGGVEHWRCGRCKDFFPVEGFYRNKRTVLGITSDCRSCHGSVSISSRDRKNYNAHKRLSEAQRRARVKTGQVTLRDVDRLFEILGKACLACGSTEHIQIDHIVPLSKGGLHHPTNLQPLCRKCNERKQARERDYRNEEARRLINSVWVVAFKRVEVGK